MGVKQRTKQASYINTGKTETSYALMGVGFTGLNEKPTAKTRGKRYINMKSETKTVTGYDWSTPFTLDQVRSEEAIEFICNIAEKQLVGADTEADYVIVDLDKTGTPTGTYTARKLKVAVAVAEFNETDGEMGASGDLLGISDMVLGTFNPSTKTFTPAV